MPDPVSPWDGGPMAGMSPRAAHNGENTVIVVIRVIAIAVTNSRAPAPAGHSTLATSGPTRTLRKSALSSPCYGREDSWGGKVTCLAPHGEGLASHPTAVPRCPEPQHTPGVQTGRKCRACLSRKHPGGVGQGNCTNTCARYNGNPTRHNSGSGLQCLLTEVWVE